MNRRIFLKTAVVLWGIGVIGTAAFLESCKKNKTSTVPQGPTVNFTLDLTQSSNAYLNISGGSITSNEVIIVNLGSSYVAIAEKCTYQGCSVNYNSNTNSFVCPCCNGTYDLNGKVTSGPPPAPLKKYTVTKNGNVLTVAG